MNKKTLFLIILCLLLALSACSGKEPSLGDNLTNFPATEPSGSDPLSVFRSEMRPPVLAYAYLGGMSMYTEESAAEWIRSEHPQWSQQYPFAAEYPEDRVIGDWGHVYAIVPRDPKSSIAVNLVFIHETARLEVKEVVYRSESGEPILILANTPDDLMYTVEITDSSGCSVIFYPDWEYAELVSPGIDPGNLAASFGPDIPYNEYNIFLADGWRIPSQEELGDTFWIADWEWALELTWQPEDLFAGPAYLYTMDSAGAYTRTYSGVWRMDGEDLVLQLHSETAGDSTLFERFPVLLSPDEYPRLWFGRGKETNILPYSNEDQDSAWMHQPAG